MKLSNNFSLAEFTKSQTAARRGIRNVPSPQAIENMKLLCEMVLEPLRRLVGGPIVINSGFRAPAVNVAVGGSATSDHTRGQAADIERPGLSNYDLANAICTGGLPFDQLILEAYRSGVPDSGWVHVSYRASGNRGQLLTANPQRGGGMVYRTGLHR